jgi:hypothetical protein
MPLSLVSLEGEGRRNETYTVKVAQLMMIISLVGFHEELGRTLTQREIQRQTLPIPKNGGLFSARSQSAAKKFEAGDAPDPFLD